MKLNKTLLSNFTSLSLLQISNYLIPLVTVPYLVRVLGPGKFGLVNFAAAFTAYFATLTDYGFNLSAPREVSINRNNRDELNKIFNVVMTIKSLLAVTSFIILLAIVESIAKFSENRSVYYLSFGLVLGQAIFPQWFFQGIEKMKHIAAITVLFRACSVVFIFLLVRTETDFLSLILINSLTQIMIGFTGIAFVMKRYKLKYELPEPGDFLYKIKEGWHIFISTSAINLYTTSNTFILGLFASQSAVGYFAAADKIRISIQSLYAVVSNTIYPHVSLLINESLNNGIKFISKVIKSIGPLALISSIMTFVFAEEIILIILGSEYTNSILVLKIISFLPFLIFLSNVTGIQIMLNAGFQKEFSMIIIVAAAINIILSIIIVPIYLEIGSSISMVFTEVFVTASMTLFLLKRGINIFRNRISLKG